MTPTRTKPPRTVSLTRTTHGKLVLWITQAGKTRAYILTPVASDWGQAFTLGKADNGDGSMDTYCVLIDNHHHHSCDCAGFTFRNKCRHVDALLALIRAGKLPTK